MEHFLEQYGYIALLIGTFLEGETAILVASSLTHTALFSWPGAVFVGFAGSFISDWIYYLIGRFNGKYFIDKRPKLKERVEPVRRFFYKHKIQVLFSYRFLYGFRIIIPLIVGMSGIKPLQYLIYSVLAGLCWAATVGAVGYGVGALLHIDVKAFEDNLIFIIIGFALFGLCVGYVIKRMTMKEMQEPV